MSGAKPAEPGLDRRAFLGGAATWLGLGGVALIAGCAPPDDAALASRLRAGLREAGYDPRAAKLLATAGEMSVSVALRALRRDVSDRRLYATAHSALLLRRFIEARCDGDLRAGRMRRVRGWWVAETELAVAVLVAT
jgi:hypothetical protein